MKVLIAGGCGFIGSNLCIFLKKNKFDVTSVDSLFRKGSILNKKKLSKKNIKNYKIDIKNLNKKKLQKFDIIVDCCAEPSVEASKKDLDRVIDTNLIGTFNLLKKSIEDKSHFIFLSSSRVFSIKKINKLVNKKNYKKEIKIKKEIDNSFSVDSPRSLYGYTKLASEELIKELSFLFGFKFIINRLGVIAGPGQMGKVDQGFFSMWIWKHLNKLPLKYIGFGGHGNQVRDVLHIDDLNDLILMQIKKIKTKNNLTFTVGGGKKNLVSLKQLTQICEKITGNFINISSVKKTSIYDLPYFCTSNKFVNKTYGWKPKLRIIDIANDILKWQKREYTILKKYLN